MYWAAEAIFGVKVQKSFINKFQRIMSGNRRRSLNQKKNFMSEYKNTIEVMI